MFRQILCVCLVASALGAVIDPEGGKIIGGVEANIKDFPHQASMQYIDLDASSEEEIVFKHVCGASILNSRTILTAAHCTDGKTVSFLRVKVGSDVRDDPNVELFEVAELIQHKDFLISTYNMDVAILKLKKDLTFSDKVKTIALNEDKVIKEGTEVVVSGWGLTQQGGHERPTTLRAVKVNMVDFNKCQTDYKNMLTASMICANAKGKDACQGDSGGPLIISSLRKLIGIVSWGEGCGQFEHPGIYTNVAYILPWIKSHL